jgi:hypothetical protein
MIHIEGKWHLRGEPLNITLCQKKIIDKSKNNKGEEYFVESGYYNTFQELTDALVRKKIRLSVGTAKTLEELNDNILAIHETIRWFCHKFEKEIKKRMQDERYTVKVPIYRNIDGNYQKIGERTIPASWGIKAIIEETGDTEDGESGEANQSDCE